RDVNPSQLFLPLRACRHAAPARQCEPPKLPEPSRVRLLCSATHLPGLRRKIVSDNSSQLGLVCSNNRESEAKSALLRGQSLGRMRSRRDNTQPPVTESRSDAFNCKALCLAFFLRNQKHSSFSSRSSECEGQAPSEFSIFHFILNH